MFKELLQDLLEEGLAQEEERPRSEGACKKGIEGMEGTEEGGRTTRPYTIGNPACMKRRYTSRDQARRVLWNMNNKSLHAYKCPKCPYWHLSTRK